MAAERILFIAEILAALALVLIAAQWSWARYRQHRLLRESVRYRLRPPADISEGAAVRVTVSPVEKILLRAGIRLSRGQLAVIGALVLAFLGVILAINGLLVSLICAGLILAALWMYWRFRFQQQRRVIYDELPGLIDTALRYMDAGRSLENALVESFRDAPPVFDPLSFRLRSAVESGRDYTGLFEDFASLYKVPSLVLVSIALRTSSRFGSSIRPVLQQVSGSLRSQQELRREFLAATAETRFTAAAFALLPMGLTAYMILMNEDYSRVLLDTSTGHTMLGVAGALQGLGIIIIWRMIQGVGRD
ncbi:type II secretion protein F [Alcanivorax sp. N3-2A]|nr:type II secretion protein F [Alcanivorax sp. N3-2A]|tara:strand:+ start:24511 stop:25428 length:918 start_codon:yes stop_codon:yes gene_type:complete